MFFNSLHFAAFFPIVLLGALALRRRVRARNAFLLVASYYFYGCWDWRFLSLIAVSTVVDYVCGRLMDVGAAPRGPRERRILLVSLGTNLGLLATFKYFDFFASSAADLLQRAGLAVDPPLLDVVLPVGVSFYTFQTLSYTIDVHRRTARDRPASFLDFALFVAFFPQLVAGPIERAARLLAPGHGAPSDVTPEQFTSTALVPRSAWGLFKKVDDRGQRCAKCSSD